MTECRKKKTGTDVWHFCTNCSAWPTKDFETKYSDPGHELCDQCLGKKKNNNCSK